MIDLRDRRPAIPVEFGPVTLGSDQREAARRRRALERARQEIADIIQAGELPFEKHFAKAWQKYRDLLGDAHYSKCAYCETRVRAGYPGAVEHYRPKTEVRELKMTQHGLRPGRTSKPGYWWAAYRFENWVFSCFSCNVAKGSYFPVQGRRSMKPGAEARESPLLINPLYQDPTGAFEFDEFGGIHARSRAAQYTLRICKLDRNQLVLEREKTAQSVVRDLEDYENAVVSDNDTMRLSVLRRLKEACSPDAPYAGMARQLVEERALLDWPTLATV